MEKDPIGKVYLAPKFLIQCTSNKTPFKQNDGPLNIALLNFIVQVVFPILQLASFKGFDMEIRPFDLQEENNRDKT